MGIFSGLAKIALSPLNGVAEVVKDVSKEKPSEIITREANRMLDLHETREREPDDFAHCRIQAIMNFLDQAHNSQK